MLVRIVLGISLVIVFALPASAQVPAAPAASPASTPAPALAKVAVPSAQYDSAFYAWQAGNYPDALQKFERMLSGAKAAEVLEPIALVTGELYATTELAN